MACTACYLARTALTAKTLAAKIGVHVPVATWPFSGASTPTQNLSLAIARAERPSEATLRICFTLTNARSQASYRGALRSEGLLGTSRAPHPQSSRSVYWPPAPTWGFETMSSNRPGRRAPSIVGRSNTEASSRQEVLAARESHP